MSAAENRQPSEEARSAPPTGPATSPQRSVRRLMGWLGAKTVLSALLGVTLTAVSFMMMADWTELPLVIASTILALHMTQAGSYLFRRIPEPSFSVLLAATGTVLGIAVLCFSPSDPVLWCMAEMGAFASAVLFHRAAQPVIHDATFMGYTRYKIGLESTGVLVGFGALLWNVVIAPAPFIFGIAALGCVIYLNVHILLRWNIYRRRYQALPPLSVPPRISIVIIAYNEEKYIGDLLDDLARQTRMPDEVLVVDDRSTDGTRAVSESFAGRIPVRVVERTGMRGAATSRNAGADAAMGDVLIFFDADTRIAPDFVEGAEAAMLRTGAAVASFDFHVDDPRWWLRAVLGFYRLVLWAVQDLEPHTVGWSIMARKDAHKHILFDETVIQAEDFDYGRRAAMLFPLRTFWTPKTVYSTRRFDKGGLRLVFVYAWFGFRRMLTGEIRRKRIQYDFGKF